MSEFPSELLTRAVAAQNRGDHAGAQALYWQILLFQPAQFDALHLLGVSKCQQGQQIEGSWFLARALEQRPDSAAAQFNLAMALAELHRHAEAIAGFDRAIALRPNHAPSWFNRGNTLQTMGRHAEAIESYQRALTLSPDMTGALTNMCRALLATGQAARAIAQLRDALAHGADSATILVGIGHAQLQLGQMAAARESFAAACSAAPDAAQPRWLWATATLPEIAVSESEIAASRTDFAAALDSVDAWYAADTEGRRDRLQLDWPFFLAYHAQDNRALMARFGRLRARLVGEWRRRQPLPEVATIGAGPIRVGIVSPQLYGHSVWFAITRGWFAHMDPARIELHAFHTGSKSDAETEFARTRSASFTVGNRSLAEWVRAIHAVRPNVLIYPAIGMDHMAANLATLRLAQVQLASWGHPDTTGLPAIDGYISAEAYEPPDSEAFYTEALIRLPGLGVSFVPPKIVPRAPDLPSLGIDPSRPVLLCPGAPFKYAPAHDGVLAAIARRVGNGQLVFFHAREKPERSSRLEQRLAASFASEGMNFTDHARFIPFQDMEGFHGLLRRADLCLDTIGFSGFNTAMQALGHGTPLVAYEGCFMRGRFASGILRVIGLPELVATDAAAFIGIATRLANDAAWRDTMRQRIAAAVPTFYDDRGPVQALQDTIENLVRRSR